MLWSPGHKRHRYVGESLAKEHCQDGQGFGEQDEHREVDEDEFVYPGEKMTKGIFFCVSLITSQVRYLTKIWSQIIFGSVQ